MSVEMYREYILQHYKSPRNYGHLDDPDIEHEDDNPLCGDQVHIEVALDEDDRIADIRFQGKGCAISQASTSIMTEKVKGKTLAEVKALSKEDVFSWLRIPISPMRVKCALLGLLVLQAGVHRYEAAREGGEGGGGAAHGQGGRDDTPQGGDDEADAAPQHDDGE